jgi:hypothetical protein
MVKFKLQISQSFEKSSFVQILDAISANGKMLLPCCLQVGFASLNLFAIFFKNPQIAFMARWTFLDFNALH